LPNNISIVYLQPDRFKSRYHFAWSRNNCGIYYRKWMNNYWINYCRINSIKVIIYCCRKFRYYYNLNFSIWGRWRKMVKSWFFRFCFRIVSLTTYPKSVKIGRACYYIVEFVWNHFLLHYVQFYEVTEETLQWISG